MTIDTREVDSLMQLPEEALKERFVASVVDAEGREIPITPGMVRSACQQLEEKAITGLHCPSPPTPAP
jgi:hypothetical protein